MANATDNPGSDAVTMREQDLLYKHVDQMFEERKAQLTESLSGLHRELQILSNTTEDRFEALMERIKATAEGLDLRLVGMNEFRKTVEDQTKYFVRREEIDAVKEQLSQITTQFARHGDVESLRVQVTDLKESRAKLEGIATQESVNSLGFRSTVGIALALIGSVIAVLSFLIRTSVIK
jgi:exonuclease VII large subunit